MSVLPTLKEFNDTVALLRKSYPFTDNARINLIENLINPNGKARLSLVEIDAETGAEVMMSHEYVGYETDEKL